MALVVVATLVAHGRSVGDDYVALDDFEYVRDNANVAGGLTLGNVAWAFHPAASREVSYFHPLTWVSLMTDVSVFGAGPRGHHLVNVLLHGCAAALLLAFLLRTTGNLGASVVAALLFAVHPLTVEAVAWITERKAVLSTAFTLSALLAYARHAERPSPARLALVAALGVAAVLAKPTLVILPALLLVVDGWPLGRLRPGMTAPELRRLLAEKVAIGLPSLAVFAVALPTLPGVLDRPLGLRVANAVVSIPRYVALSLWPHDLAPFHPFPGEVATTDAVLAIVACALLTAAAVATARRWPFLLAGWAWFLVAVAPYLGLKQNGLWPAYADRFMYLPLVGLAIAAAFGGAAALRAWPRVHAYAPVLAAVAIVPLANASYAQGAFWQDSIALFGRGVAIHPDSGDMTFGLGTAYSSAGRLQEALPPLARTVELKPVYAPARAKYGLALVYVHRYDEAGAHLDEALRLSPRLPEALFARAQLLTGLGFAAQARLVYAEFLQSAPDTPEMSLMRAEARRRSR
jgi:Flp pilus assembly protein TadD